MSASAPTLLLAAFAAACLAQLARQLMKDTLPRPRRVLAAILGAGLAGLTAGALVLEGFRAGLPLLLAVGTVVGWSGAGVLAALGDVLEGQLGFKLRR